ncbi:uncharacterized protein B0H18DRAFT_1117582 [Fomitopsis serialis]|uniref:uncharacterized protein n=1 Tax=Fomitopsis serialis TaxID=139415 RepID=UPI002008044D|nr:uncharacterized protein B0H18DRAFT_1117582 [Neoantrodia serialis]KAH9929236.1 hypothetical protein B0H18DRAFT_1117582 [Neoantrodia serialis]
MAPRARNPRSLGEVTELIAIILSFLDNRSLARSARVSRKWSEIALDILWREVDDLHRLFSTLCPFAKPMKKMGEGGRMLQSFKYKRNISKQDWQRFARYSTRVRRLVFNERSPKYRTKVIDNSVFFLTSQTRPLAGILPNLQTFVWHVHNPDTQLQSMSLMHECIRAFDVQILPRGSHSTQEIDFIWQIGARMPNLTHLTLRRRGPVRELEKDICRLHHGGVSRLKDLQEIALTGPDEGGMGDSTDVVGFSPALQDGAFPVLRRLSFSALLPAATEFIESHSSLPSSLDSTLVELTVDFIICPTVPLTVPAPDMDARPSIATFRPLFACRRITSFEFRWDYPLHLQDDDMEEFSLAWPGLEHLMLNSEAVIEFTSSALTLGALVPFANHCPRLRHLGLYLNADAPPSRMVDQPFRSLQKLSVGASSITAADAVALFLSQLCSPICQIVSGLRWPDAYGLALDNAGIFDERRTMICDFGEERGRVAFLQRETG